MVGARIERREQHEEQIDRQAIDRIEVDRPRELEEQAAHAAEIGHLGVRQGDAAAEAGRSQPFAFEQGFADFAGIEAERAAGEVADEREKRLFRIDLHVRTHGRRIEKGRKIHRRVKSCSIPAAARNIGWQAIADLSWQRPRHPGFGHRWARPLSRMAEKIQSYRGSTQPIVPSSRR